VELCVGIDLAWGTRARTGLAACDPTGRLVASANVVSDDEIAGWLSDLEGDPVVVGIDAPLVVPNATGQRPAENLVQRTFGRFHAGAYPANRANPLFDPPRAAGLAERLGWDPDPARTGTTGRPTCLEVHPHAATVALFGLDRVLPYKARRGRTPASRRVAFVQLMGHLESVPELRLHDDARWRELRGLVEGATRHVHLERIEDEVDAVTCAYVAWLWRHRPGVLRVYGSLEEGYIVAPAIGADGL
jgi:predicted RNase H-like nuclease